MLHAISSFYTTQDNLIQNLQFQKGYSALHLHFGTAGRGFLRIQGWLLSPRAWLPVLLEVKHSVGAITWLQIALLSDTISALTVNGSYHNLHVVQESFFSELADHESLAFLCSHHSMVFGKLLVKGPQAGREFRRVGNLQLKVLVGLFQTVMGPALEAVALPLVLEELGVREILAQITRSGITPMYGVPIFPQPMLKPKAALQRPLCAGTARKRGSGSSLPTASWPSWTSPRSSWTSPRSSWTSPRSSWTSPRSPPWT